MIYLIDDKKSRQRDYGWDEKRLSSFSQVIKPIWGIETLNADFEEMFQEENVILFHESFPSSDEFQKKLRANSNRLYIAYFSGSKGGRFVAKNKCMLPPDVLYQNLEVFLKKMQEGQWDFQYLAFGENFEQEEQLRHRIIEVNHNNADENKEKKQSKISSSKSIFFAATSDDLAVDPPIQIEPMIDWDQEFNDRDITDIDLDDLVNEWFSQNKYDVIYIPLCFGSVLSDFMGLRLAMHIRLTQTPNQSTPLYIYGEVRLEEIVNHYCFEVLKMPNSYLIDCSNYSFLESLKRNLNEYSLKRRNDFYLRIPSNLGDNHNVANKWAIFRWIDMIQWNNNVPTFEDEEFMKSVYFKYLVSKYGNHDRFKKTSQKCNPIIAGISGKSIVYIDDEYENGWGRILKNIIEDCSDASFHPFMRFDKRLSRDELVSRIERFIDDHDADCYIIDLRLHESDFESGSQLTGHEIGEYIKSKNKGNQIVIFTASNKIWNLKRDMFETHFSGELSGELKIGAVDYILKESPDLNLSRLESRQIFKDFHNAIKRACEMSYLKALFDKQDHLKSICPVSSQLDSVINLLCIDNGNNEQDVLKAALLEEIVFLEEFIKSHLGYKLLATGKDSTLKIDLCCDRLQVQRRITGHIFFRREQIGEYKPVVDVSPYQEIEVEPKDGWCNVSTSDVTLVSAYLMMELNLDVTDVKKYINFKRIRNTQIAHGGGYERKIEAAEIVDFFYSVICPMVEHQ